MPPATKTPPASKLQEKEDSKSKERVSGRRDWKQLMRQNGDGKLVYLVR